MTTPTPATDLEDYDRQWLATLESTPFTKLIFGLAGLTRLGERPTSLARLARLIDRTPIETSYLVHGATSAQVDGDTVTWEDPFPGQETRRTLHVGERAIPMRFGCGPDLFGFAAALDVPWWVEDTCGTTGAPIRIDFVPGGFDRADPPETVTVQQPIHQMNSTEFDDLYQVDVDVCAIQPFFSSREAAEPLMAAHPGSRAFTIAEMFERPWVAHYRDILGPLIHPDTH